jgi:protein-disulfide isomerase
VTEGAIVRLSVPVTDRDHVRGPQGAPVTLLEYGDFECPQCGRVYPIVKQVEAAFGDRLRFVFRNFPLTNTHPNAQRAAEADEWAAAQSRDAFWPMHDALYEQQARLSESRILAIAGDLKLDPSSLAEAWRTHAFFARVKQDFLGGLRSQVTGTPTFFVNGLLLEGACDLESLAGAVQAALNDPAAAPPDPAPPAPGAGPPR